MEISYETRERIRNIIKDTVECANCWRYEQGIFGEDACEYRLTEQIVEILMGGDDNGMDKS